MKPSEYITDVLKTESCDIEAIKGRLLEESLLYRLGGVLDNLSIQTAELDCLKKYIFYGRDLGEYSSKFPEFEDLPGLKSSTSIRLLHGIIGIATESGELIENLSEWVSSDSKPTPDTTNIKEELGDLLWYIAVCIYIVGEIEGKPGSFEEVMNTNIAKLKARYGEKFSEASATDRDLKKEREILER